MVQARTIPILHVGTGRTVSIDSRRSSALRGIVVVEGIAKTKGPSSFFLLHTVVRIPKLRCYVKDAKEDSMRS